MAAAASGAGRRACALAILLAAGALLACGDDAAGGGPDGGGARADGGRPRADGGPTSPPAPTCDGEGGATAVQAPVFVRNLRGETSWYASPLVVDLDGDGRNELVAAYYSVFVFDAAGTLLGTADGGEGRVYAPHVVADLDGDGVVEIVYGNDHEVWAYEWRDGALAVKDGWPADVTTAGNPPEVRGLAAADLDGDGTIEVVATTTQTERTEDGGAQVFVFSADGSLYRPAGASFPAWPRYDRRSGEGGDADRNGAGHHGFGCYGLNVGIGELDDDPELEIVVTYDNHHIQLFDHDGVAHDASPWFRQRQGEYLDMPMTWGQFIRFADLGVEERHYHLHEGDWPGPATDEWLQWTASPPSVVDLDGDGHDEVVGVPNVELHEPYETQAFAVMVLDGDHGDGSRSAMRHAGWETLPRGGAPILVDGYYPPLGVPAPTLVDLAGDARPEIVVALNDGAIHAFDAQAQPLWTFDHTHGHRVMYASEVVAGDLNRDGSPELVFSTYGDPDTDDSGWLVVLDAAGRLLHDVPLPGAGHNGNGNGAPAAPALGDLDGDGALEIFVQTFDHGMDVFTVPGSGTRCLPWPTARGGPLRQGRAGG